MSSTEHPSTFSTYRPKAWHFHTFSSMAYNLATRSILGYHGHHANDQYLALWESLLLVAGTGHAPGKEGLPH